MPNEYPTPTPFELPLCPSSRLRRIKYSTIETICNRCDSKGWYVHNNVKLVCSYYWDTFVPLWLEKNKQYQGNPDSEE